MSQDHSGYLASQLNEAQNEVAQLRSDLRRSEADLETERSKLRENVAFADKEKVSWCVCGHLSITIVCVDLWDGMIVLLCCFMSSLCFHYLLYTSMNYIRLCYNSPTISRHGSVFLIDPHSGDLVYATRCCVQAQPMLSCAVCLSVCLDVCHVHVFCRNEYIYL